jgi:hypothetical protein
MSYAIGVGYPLRLEVGKTGLIETVDLRSGRLTLEGEQAAMWASLFHLQEYPREWETELLQLKALGAVVMAETPQELLGLLSQLCPVRQGYCVPGEKGDQICLGGRYIPLTDTQRSLWLAADGQSSLGKTLDQVLPGARATEESKALLREILKMVEAELYFLR